MKIIALTFLFSFLMISVKSSNFQKDITVSPDIRLIQLTENCYLHETWFSSSQLGRFSSNGLLVIKNGKALMVDTPFNNELTKALYEYLKDSMNVLITIFIGGHFHNDCIGGMGYLKEKGVKCILGTLTREKCMEYHLPMPDLTFKTQFDFSFEGLKTECRYFGGGHTEDNVVVYISEDRLLFGGCLIKTLECNNIGNIADAKTDEWVNTVEMIKAAFSDVEIVIPGHGVFGNKDLLDHTIEVVENYLKTKQ
jgi:metallo-beta-lactamase class B